VSVTFEKKTFFSPPFPLPIREFVRAPFPEGGRLRRVVGGAATVSRDNIARLCLIEYGDSSGYFLWFLKRFWTLSNTKDLNKVYRTLSILLDSKNTSSKKKHAVFGL
jgi:hypothetical protein